MQLKLSEDLYMLCTRRSHSIDTIIMSLLGLKCRMPDEYVNLIKATASEAQWEW